MAKTGTHRRGFTLTELLVVIGVVLLALAAVLPSLRALFSSGAEAQGRNVVAAVLNAARGLAVESQNYTAVHFQIGKPGEREMCWMAVLIYDDRDPEEFPATAGKFIPAPGYIPQSMPGSLAVGEIDHQGRFIVGNKFEDMTYLLMPDFTTFNVIFSPDGTLARTVNDDLPEIYLDPTLWNTDPDVEAAIWSDLPSVAEDGANAMAIFDYKILKATRSLDQNITDVRQRAIYLEQNATYLIVNPYTGRLIVNE